METTQRGRSATLAAALVLTFGCGTVAAQRPPESGGLVVSGRVVAGQDAGLPGVEVLGESGSVLAVTNTDGDFTVYLGPGRKVLLFRGVGFRPRALAFDLPGDTAWSKRVVLEPLAAELPEIEVTATPARYSGIARMDDFVRRRMVGRGVFKTRDDWIREAPLETADLLNRVSGVRLRQSAFYGKTQVEFTRCSGAAGNKVTVWIDGARVRAADHNDALSQITPRDLEAIEIYRSASEIPAEFFDGGCAAIVLWSRVNY